MSIELITRELLIEMVGKGNRHVEGWLKGRCISEVLFTVETALKTRIAKYQTRQEILFRTVQMFKVHR